MPMSWQTFHCDECGWSTTFYPEFTAHQRQRHGGGETVPWVVRSGIAKEGFSYQTYYLKLFFVVLLIVLAVLAAKGYF